MSGPYRTAVKTDEDAVPDELAYHPEERHSSSSAVAMAVFLWPLLIGIAFAVIGLPELSLPAVLVFGAAAYFSARRRRRRAHAVLRVADGLLYLTGSGVPDINLPLDKLLDVRLDTKTIQPVMETPGPVPSLRFINSRVGGDVDIARIELVRRDDSIFLTSDYLSHTDSSDWAGKIRRFLRKHGWLPADERKAEASRGAGGSPAQR